MDGYDGMEEVELLFACGSGAFSIELNVDLIIKS
jgi:hypothetical protein